MYPDFYVECDKDGNWWIVGVSEGLWSEVDSPKPIGPYPSKAHVVNGGIEIFGGE